MIRATSSLKSLRAGFVGLAELLLLAGLVHRLLGRVGKRLAIGAAVVGEGDALAGEALRQEGAGDAALVVVAAAEAEGAGPGTLVGEFRVRRGGRDLHDAGLRIDLRRRHRSEGAEMSGHEDDLLADHLVGDGGRLRSVAIVVADFERQLLPEDAARRVDVRDGARRARLHLLAEDLKRAGHRPGRADGDVGEGWRGAGRRGRRKAIESVRDMGPMVARATGREAAGAPRSRQCAHGARNRGSAQEKTPAFPPGFLGSLSGRATIALR